eukprot:2478766-Pleurochrysis_carterae.AAC.1
MDAHARRGMRASVLHEASGRVRFQVSTTLAFGSVVCAASAPAHGAWLGVVKRAAVRGYVGS